MRTRSAPELGPALPSSWPSRTRARSSRAHSTDPSSGSLSLTVSERSPPPAGVACGSSQCLKPPPRAQLSQWLHCLKGHADSQGLHSLKGYSLHSLKGYSLHSLSRATVYFLSRASLLSLKGYSLHSLKGYSLLSLKGYSLHCSTQRYAAHRIALAAPPIQYPLQSSRSRSASYALALRDSFSGLAFPCSLFAEGLLPSCHSLHAHARLCPSIAFMIWNSAFMIWIVTLTKL
jgi:hypothetical protein